MSQNQLLPAFILERFAGLPAVLSFIQVAVFFGISGCGIARRYERGTLQIRVVQNGGGLGVLAADLAKYLADGEKQHQPKLPVRAPRNPHGRWGKEGKRPARRPTKSEQIAARQAGRAA